MQSVWEGQDKFDPARDDAMTIGDSKVMRMTEALATDFEAAFREAYSSFAEDSDPENPNGWPKDCWPSAREFRNILFQGGTTPGAGSGEASCSHPRCGSPSLCANRALRGHRGPAQVGGLTTRQPSKRKLDRMFGPPLPDIRWPKCQWTPRTKNLWSCRCGHRWNTFDTRGLCPACRYQWELTECPECGTTSPHAEWYAGKRL
jgi:hypothetical protein